MMEEFEKYYRSRNKFRIRSASQIFDDKLNSTLDEFDNKIKSINSYLSNYDLAFLENTSIINSLVFYLGHSGIINNMILNKGISEEREKLSKKVKDTLDKNKKETVRVIKTIVSC